MSHGHVYAISQVIHNDSFEKVDFNINLHGDYKSYENLEFFWNFWNFLKLKKKNFFRILKFFENFEILWNLMKTQIFEIFENFEILWKFWICLKFLKFWNF